MFKELGEFIDNVGRATGRMIGQIFSEDEPIELDGDIAGLPENLPEDLREILNEDRRISKVVYNPHKHKIDNNQED